MRDELIKDLAGLHSLEDCADFILAREREMAEKIRKMVSIIPDYWEGKNIRAKEALDFLDEIIKEA